MSTIQVAHFRELLRHRREELANTGTAPLGSELQADREPLADPNDRATQEEEYSLQLHAQNRERRLLHKIDEALLRLDSGIYGYCADCGEEIGAKRLEARPTATLCIECKTRQEIREKQIAQD